MGKPKILELKQDVMQDTKEDGGKSSANDVVKHSLGREWVHVLATVQYKFSRFESACVLIPWSIINNNNNR